MLFRQGSAEVRIIVQLAKDLPTTEFGRYFLNLNYMESRTKESFWSDNLYSAFHFYIVSDHRVSCISVYSFTVASLTN